MSFVAVEGTISDGPRFHRTSDGRVVATITVREQIRDRILYHCVKCWDDEAGILAEKVRTFHCRDTISVVGTLDYHSWTSNDGKEHDRAEIKARDIERVTEAESIGRSNGEL